MTSPTASGAEEKPLPPTPSAQTPGSPVDPSYPNLSHPQAPADPPPLQPDPAGQQPPAAAPSSGPDPTIGNAFNQAGRLGNDVASGGVQIAVGQAIGNTTGAQQDPPGVQSGQDAVSDLPALADGSNLNVGDVIGGLSAPFKGE
jgi:hypothetical protein